VTMSVLEHVPVGVLSTDRYESVLDPEKYKRFTDAIEVAQQVFEGRVVWNINSTAKGGGVAEMLRSLLAYARAAGVDARWTVITAEDPEFFNITKRIHNHLHGAAGDGGDLGDTEREVYEAVAHRNTDELVELVAPDDIVIVHDPQPAGLIAPLKKKGATVLWRCHVGLDLPNDLARKAWNFLLPYVRDADGYVFSRRDFAWEGLDTDKLTIIPPSIDAFSPKNQELDEENVRSILVASKTLTDGIETAPVFTREDGSPGRVDRTTVYYDGGDPPPYDAQLVVQVSRWDRLKDPVGVMKGFAEYIAPHSAAHLVLAGPSVEAVADDPEGAEVLDEARDVWKQLPEGARDRVHLATLPMDDGEENAAIVNALQRRATVVVQKSIAEGFGLTVAEAMWKARPVVASRIGGIQDQIVSGTCGLLVDDPADLEAYGKAVNELLDDPERATEMGRAAQARIRNEFLGARHLMQYVDLIGKLL
jgi:trehalose synthase